ncbi:MAG: helix-turn-helix transcriptional regulator [Proteobacteria bacterium]|nr:helix-turn-helix transcriptional regulator [Pseudomonadota bacterium]
MTEPIPLNPDRIGDAGRQLFGEHWQSSLASALGIDVRLLRYWLNGQEKPSQQKLLALVALLERSAADNRRLAGQLRKVAGIPPAPSRWTFDSSELRCVDRTTVEHVPTGSKVVFYEYLEEPPDEWVPGGTITNAALWSEDELVRFNVAAWKLLASHRYGPDLRAMRRVVRTCAHKVPIGELVRIAKRENPMFTERRITAALKELEYMGEIAFIGAQAIQRLAGPNPIVRRRVI